MNGRERRRQRAKRQNKKTRSAQKCYPCVRYGPTKIGRGIDIKCKHRQFFDFLQLYSATDEWIIQECSQLYANGASLRELATRIGISKTKVRKTLIQSGVDLREATTSQNFQKSKPKRCRAGVSPYGFIWIGNKLVADPKETQNIQLIVSLHQQGLNLRQISEKLNLLGKKTRSRKPWEHSLIRRLILRHSNQKQSK